MKALLQALGSRFLATVEYFGQLGTLGAEVVVLAFRGRIRPRLVWRETGRIGVGSQIVVMITGAATGGVFAAQIYSKFNDIGLATATGPMVSVAMFRELGPVITGLMISGRVGAAMAAEIGTMRVTEQIDALRSMAVNPVEYLVVPRFFASLISMPILVAEAILLGILAADFLTVRVFGVPEAWFRHQLLSNTGMGDVMTGLIKGVVFGILIVLISCRHGLHTREGAVGVGKATTRAMVDSSVAILIVNLFLTLILNEWLPMISLQF